MPTSTTRRKRARNMAKTPTGNKRQKQRQDSPVSDGDDLEGIDVTGERLGTKVRILQELTLSYPDHAI